MASVILAACAGCATQPLSHSPALAAWSSDADCFSRSVTPSSTTADAMALACAGPSAAANPARSGIDRATAYFNAAAAFNVLAEAGGGAVACETRSGCFEFALRLLEKSAVNQEDALMDVAGSAGPAVANEYFKLRRALERTRALRGAAETRSEASACGDPEACLAAASGALSAYDLDSLASHTSGLVAATACDALSLSADIYLQRGRDFEFAAITDLRRVLRLCPSLSADASTQLANLAFRRGEQLRRSMDDAIAAGTAAQEAADLGASALSSYRDALNSPTLRLLSYRGIGHVGMTLAALEPSRAAAHLASAAEAFNSAQQLSAGEPAESHAEDLTLLGRAYLDLASSKQPISAIEQDTLVSSATRVLERAVTLAPNDTRRLTLSEALAAAGRYDDAKAAYQAALSAPGGTAREEAALALAALHEKSGQLAAALSVLESAAAPGAGSSRLRYEIGRLRFLKGDPAGALEALPTGAADLGTARMAEAHYMASVAERILARPGWQDRARTLADKAVQASSASVKYTRQDCLSHILSGGKDLKSGANLYRCPVDESPERLMLRGMYFLKQAQLIDVSAYDSASLEHWRSVLRLAEDAFRSGLDAYGKAPPAKRKVRFDDLARDIDLGTALSQGLVVIDRCRRETTIPAGSQEWQDLEAFYGKYGVLKCSAD